jgi:hypothetical protein
MELADDMGHGQEIDEATYTPRNLRSELHLRGRLPVAECLRIGLALTAANSKVVVAVVQTDAGGTSGIDEIESRAGGVFRSSDRGETWQRLRGYNFKWGYRPVFDPHHPGMIYLTTFGGSVFYGPAKGDSAAVEDIENFSDNWRWQAARPVARKK